MNRRDFLVLRFERATRVVDLSCQRLFMHYQQATGSRVPVRSGPTLGDDEPAPAYVVRTTDEVMSEVSRALAAADVVRLRETEWLAVDRFARDLEALLDVVRRRGGRVEV